MEDHEIRRKIIREWMALPKDKRQTEEQVAAFAKRRYSKTSSIGVGPTRIRNFGATFGEAARQWGVAKGTISKAIKTGKPSATRREDGSWSIDKAELARYLDAPLGNGRR
jgi:hypothetical protein